jgi:hypothetical protein
MTGGGVAVVCDCGGGVAAAVVGAGGWDSGGGGGLGVPGAGVVGLAGGDGARRTGTDGLRPDRRVTRTGAVDAPPPGTGRATSRRRTALPVVLRTSVAGTLAGATTDGCGVRDTLGGGGVGRTATPMGASVPR